ncbi:MAG: alkaline phosphatase family protein [Firmicutes bacterium]|nr:alkaline phosphatase family protein [Bacillota bacterium]
MKKTLIAFVLLLLAALSAACGAEYAFTVIDGTDCREETLSRGGVIDGPALIYTAAGDVFYAEDYRVEEALTGGILDPPDYTQMDVFRLTEEALAEQGRALVVYIDGLGWEGFRQALDRGDLPVLSELNVVRAAGVYPTITPVNYAAMVTGQPPRANGVTTRGIHQLQCPTIFDYCHEQSISCCAVEGDLQILVFPDTELELNPDLNGSGSGDDEVFDFALAALEDHDFVFVHFHSLDDSEHDCGPESEEARAALIQIDQWCGQLLGAWQGPVIICSDHGQHDNDGSGDPEYADRSGSHGDFLPSDIFVPIFTR